MSDIVYYDWLRDRARIERAYYELLKHNLEDYMDRNNIRISYRKVTSVGWEMWNMPKTGYKARCISIDKVFKE